MAVTVFITGITGYVGGDAFVELHRAHPDWQYACLVRSEEAGHEITKQYPDVRVVRGGLDDLETLTTEARRADIVLNCASADHLPAARALIDGLQADERRGRAGYLIHTSGTGVLAWRDMEASRYGEPSDEVYDDWEGLAELTSIPAWAVHRAGDQVVLGAAAAGLKTAIVCPATIYGVSRGPGNARGQQLYQLAKCTIEAGHSLQVGAGRNRWTNVHVADVSRCFVALAEAAAAGGGAASWGAEGYYLLQSGEHVWGEAAAAVAKEAHRQGLIGSDRVASISAEAAGKLTRAGNVLWGTNARARAVRARRELGWTPRERSFEAEMPEAVASEGRRLGVGK